jgi:hypothetical protein
MRLLNKIKLKAVIGGLISFLIIYLVYMFLPKLAFYVFNDTKNAILFVIICGYINYFISGYISGFLAKEQGVINAAVVGLLSPFFIAIYLAITSHNISFIISAFIDSGLFWVLSGLLLTGLGGLVWDLQGKILNKGKGDN